MNFMMLKQARSGIQRLNKLEGQQLTLRTYPTKDNGFGVLIPDDSKPLIDKKIIARVQLDQKGPVMDGPSPAGLSTNLARFIITDWQTVITEKAIIIGLEREYIINAVTPLIKFGGIYAYQAVLIEGTK